MKRLDISGQRFSRLVAISPDGRGKWMCQCDCGGVVFRRAATLRIGHDKSCGCLLRELREKQKTVTAARKANGEYSLYKIWTAMKARCNNPNHPSFSHYGGRGIKVCRRWNASFDQFLADMGPRPAGYTLERVDNDKGYSPDNCRWATRAEQSANTRRAIILEYEGRVVPLLQATSLLAEGVTLSMVRDRLRRNWTVNAALKTPRMKRGTVQRELRCE